MNKMINKYSMIIIKFNKNFNKINIIDKISKYITINNIKNKTLNIIN